MMHELSLRRRCLLGTGGVLFGLGFLSASWATAPMSKSQAPGYFRMMLGQMEITALCDGLVDLDAKLFRNATDAEIRELLARRFIAGPKIPTSVNAYLINTGSKLVLVDTGGGRGVRADLRPSGQKPQGGRL